MLIMLSMILLFDVKTLLPQSWVYNNIISTLNDKIIFGIVFEGQKTYILTNKGLITSENGTAVDTYFLNINSRGALSLFKSNPFVVHNDNFNVILSDSNIIWIIDKIDGVCLKLDEGALENLYLDKTNIIYDCDANGKYLWCIAVPRDMPDKLEYKMFHNEGNNFIELKPGFKFPNCCLFNFKVYDESQYFLYAKGVDSVYLLSLSKNCVSKTHFIEKNERADYQFYKDGNYLYIMSSSGKIFRIKGDSINEFKVSKLNPSFGFGLVVNYPFAYYTTKDGLERFDLSTHSTSLFSVDGYNNKMLNKLFYNSFNNEMWITYQYKIRGIDTCSGISIFKVFN